MESNKVICKQCNFLLTKINDGRYPNGKDKRFKDEFGGEWSGRVCPSCHKTNNRNRMRKYRNEKILYPTAS